MTLKSIDFGEELIGSMAAGAVALLFAAKRGATCGNPAWGFPKIATFEEVKEKFGLNSHTVSGLPVHQSPLSAAIRIDEIVDQWLEGRDGTKKIASVFAPAPKPTPEPAPEPTED